jgi:autotransporter translocation and assembly factor TamB
LNGKPKLQGNVFVPLSLSQILAQKNWLAALGADPNFDLDVTLDPIDLAELATAVTSRPNMSGQAAGKIQIYGRPATLEMKSDLHGRDLMWENEPRVSADLQGRLALGSLSAKASATFAGSDPLKLEATIPLQLGKRETEYAFKSDGPIFATLNFPAIFLGKLPRFISRGIFHGGILSGQLAISDSLGHPRILGDLQLIDGRFGVGASLSSLVTFGGQNATIAFAQLRQDRALLSARGEVDFHDLSAIALALFPSARLRDSTSLEPGDCITGIEFSAIAVPAFASRLVNRIDLRGSFSGPAWTISLSQEPEIPLPTPLTLPRTIPFCPPNGAPGKTLILTTAPPSFSQTGGRAP